MMNLVTLKRIIISLVGLAFFVPMANAVVDSAITIESGKQTTIRNVRQIARVAVGNPEIADVTLISERQILVTAKSPGATSLIVWHKGGKGQGNPDYSRDILVTASSGLQKHAVKDLLSSSLNVSDVGNKVALSGQASSLEAHTHARQAMQEEKEPVLDRSFLAFDNQVQIDIKIVEISRDKMKNAGFFLGKNTSNSTLAISSPNTLSGVSSSNGALSLLSTASGFFPEAQAFNLIFGSGSEGVLGVVSALESNGFAYVLAEPSLVAMSGKSASFLAGGEFPVPVRAGGNINNGITVTFKEFGIRLKLTPTVLGADRIALKVAPEVSELDFSAGIQSGGVSVPALKVRRTDTSVAMGDGESFVISGLISQNTLANVDKLPWIGDIPILGAFFRASNIDRNDRELIMVVSPHIVRPIAKGVELPALPGEKFKKYDPDYYHLFAEETGDYGVTTKAKIGFSK